MEALNKIDHRDTEGIYNRWNTGSLFSLLLCSVFKVHELEKTSCGKKKTKSRETGREFGKSGKEH